MNEIVIDIGCGKTKIGNVGLDIIKTPATDILCDINIAIPIKNSVADKIIASHVLEHSDNFIKIMEEIHRVLRPGGIAVIRCPHVRSLCAFADPTHKRYFTATTMDYLTENCYFNYYTNVRFKIIKKKIRFLPKWNWLMPIYNLRPDFTEKFLIDLFDAEMYWELEKV